MAQGGVDEINKRKTTDYNVLAKEIGKGNWGDRAEVIQALTGFKNYEWSKVVEACRKNGVKIKA